MSQAAKPVTVCLAVERELYRRYRRWARANNLGARSYLSSLLDAAMRSDDREYRLVAAWKPGDPS